MKQNSNTILNDFIRYVSINCLGMIGLSCYILADTYFVSKALGTTGLAALNISISVYSVIQGLGLLIGIGGATHFSILKAKKESNDALLLSLLLWGIVSVCLVSFGLFFTTPLSWLLGADASTLPLTTVYISTILYFSPCFILNNIMLAFVRNDNNPVLPMIAMIASSLSNIVLDYVFMFPFSMGIFGAVLATCLAPIISLGILSIHFFSKNRTISFQKVPVCLKNTKNIITYGFSSMIGELASAVTLITFNLVTYRIAGNTGVAAYGIIANTALIITALFVGISQGLQPLASTAYGQGNAGSISKIKKYSIVTAFTLATISYLAIFIFSDAIIAAFNSEKNMELATLARQGMTIYFIGYFFAGFNIVIAAFLSSIARTKSAFAISLLRSFFLIIPTVLLLSTLLGMNGVWISFLLTESIVTIIAYIIQRNPKAPTRH